VVTFEDETAPPKGYAFDAAWHQERERLGLIEARQDDLTIRVLETVGIRRGIRCLEVGAGGGSIAQWLCFRVGPTGHVVATDINTTFLAAMQLPNLTVRRHDIVQDALEPQAFDLVHSRAVLQHLPERDTALSRMIAAVKPGGWIVLQGTDFSTVTPTTARGATLFTRVIGAVEAFFVAKGFAWRYGRETGGSSPSARADRRPP
jgi:ubiquinone/menaquinone biosynthesis C-methylase UbiE